MNNILSLKKTVDKQDQRSAAKSQLQMRLDWGMRPRESINARKIERRAKHTIKGASL